MKRIVLLLVLGFGNSLLYAQVKEKKSIEFYPDISFSVITNRYFGDNYLSKGHRIPSIGAQIKTNWFHFRDFGLGFGVEKSTQSVSDFSLGGNISKTNTNSIFSQLTYNIKLNSKFILSPEINYGGIELRQKKGSKFYGRQNGSRYGIGVNLDYMLDNYVSLFSNISYNRYNLNVNTSEEFINYFDHSNALSISLGIKFH